MKAKLANDTDDGWRWLDSMDGWMDGDGDGDDDADDDADDDGDEDTYAFIK